MAAVSPDNFKTPPSLERIRRKAAVRKLVILRAFPKQGKIIQRKGFRCGIESDTLEEKSNQSIIERMSLDAIFDINRIQHCDFLKLDCEGCEFDVLLGASQSTLQKISQISLEYHDGFTQYTHADLASYLERNGFKIRLASNPVHSYLGFLYAQR